MCLFGLSRAELAKHSIFVILLKFNESNARIDNVNEMRIFGIAFVVVVAVGVVVWRLSHFS